MNTKLWKPRLIPAFLLVRRPVRHSFSGGGSRSDRLRYYIYCLVRLPLTLLYRAASSAIAIAEALATAVAQGRASL